MFCSVAKRNFLESASYFLSRLCILSDCVSLINLSSALAETDDCYVNQLRFVLSAVTAYGVITQCSTFDCSICISVLG